MKNLVFTALVGLAMVGFTGCTNSSDAEVAKCQGAKKCDGSKKCKASGKCGDSKKAKKCASSGKCGK